MWVELRNMPVSICCSDHSWPVLLALSLTNMLAFIFAVPRRALQRTRAVADEKYDAIIVGGGTGGCGTHCLLVKRFGPTKQSHRHLTTTPAPVHAAGCVLAERLSADPRKKVLVLEAGGKVCAAACRGLCWWLAAGGAVIFDG